VTGGNARRTLPGALSAAWLLAGCAGSAPPAAAPDGDLSREAIQRIVTDVQAIRGLPARHPIAIEQLDERSFTQAIDVRQAPAFAEGIDRMQAALSFADSGPRSVLQAQRILHEQLLGFYEQGSGKVYLRGGARSGDRDMQRLTLAHEVQHALQDQHFGTLGIKGLLDEDARLARLALLEGDATITGVAYLAVQQGVPIRRAMVRLARTTRLLPSHEVVGDSGPELARAPAIERERLIFPYVSGTGFAAELYRAGGFPLLDRALARPPDTTEQVLHPERYVAGEAAIPVRAPMPPAGYAAIATGRMGELQTRGLLLPCVGWESAARAAEGWGGDAFTVVTSKQGERAALWSTAWDTEPDAVEFEQALGMSAACLPALGGDGVDGRGLRAPPAARLAREGTKVALVVGLPPDRLAPAAGALLALPEAPMPPAPPVGEAQVRPLPPRLQARLGTLRGADYASAWLGLVALVPPGFAAAVGREDAELFLERQGALGVLGLSDRAASAWTHERTFDELAKAFAKGAGVEIAAVETGTYTLPIGVVTMRRWQVPGTPVEAAAVLAPICEGTGAYVIMLAWASPEDKAGLDQWLLSLRRLSPAPPVCSELNPE
jgi:hypothetical protein